ncbi:MAG: MFS transporter [Raoultibacter sp.]
MAAKTSSLPYYLVVATGIALCIAPCAMPLSCAGIFYPSIVKYLAVSNATLALYMTVLGLSIAVALPFAGKLMEKYDLRILLSVSVILIGGTLIAMSFFTQVWHWYIAGVPLGIGIAFNLYLAVPTLIGRWFKKRVGFFIGLCMAFTGVGGIIFNSIGGMLIASGPEGWRLAYLVFGIIALVIALPFTLFAIRSFPADKGLLPYGSDEILQEGEAPTAPVLTGVSASRAMRTGPFFALALFAGLATLATVLFQFLPTYAMTFADTAPAIAGAAAVLASSVMLGQALGKIFLGTVNDKSVYYGLAIGIVCGLIGFALMWIIPFGLVAILLAGGFIFGIFYATATVQVPLMTRKVFGTREYSSIYSRISTVAALSAAFGATIWGFLIDISGFNVVFIIAIALIALAGVLGVYVLKAGEKLEHTES